MSITSQKVFIGFRVGNWTEFRQDKVWDQGWGRVGIWVGVRVGVRIRVGVRVRGRAVQKSQFWICSCSYVTPEGIPQRFSPLPKITTTMITT